MSKTSILAALAAGANSGSQYFGMVSQEAFLSKKRKETADYEAGLSSAAAAAKAEAEQAALAEDRTYKEAQLVKLQEYETTTAATKVQSDQDAAKLQNAHAIVMNKENFTQDQFLQAQRLLVTSNEGAAGRQSTEEMHADSIAAAAAEQGRTISAKVEAALQSQAWQAAAATIGHERAITMAQKTEAFTLKRDELQNIALGERDAALASIAKDHATYMQGLSIEERKIQMGLDTEAFKKQAKFSAGLKKLEPTQAADAVIQNDLRMQKDNDAIKSQVDVMNIMQELLKDDDVDGVISDKLKELSNALGWSFTDGQPRKAVWDMLQTILATDKLALFTGSTTDYEYKVVKSMFPGAGMDAASAKAQLDVYLSLAMGTYNDNVSRLQVNRETQVGFNTLTDKQGQTLGGSNTAKVAAPNQDESNIDDVPEDWRQYTK